MLFERDYCNYKIWWLSDWEMLINWVLMLLDVVADWLLSLVAAIRGQYILPSLRIHLQLAEMAHSSRTTSWQLLPSLKSLASLPPRSPDRLSIVMKFLENLRDGCCRRWHDAQLVMTLRRGSEPWFGVVSLCHALKWQQKCHALQSFRNCPSLRVAATAIKDSGGFEPRSINFSQSTSSAN